MKTMINNKIVAAFIFAFCCAPVFAVQAVDIVDSDADGLTDTAEVETYGTNPNLADTDGDGFLDWKEVDGGYSPVVGGGVRLATTDFDTDGLMDDLEVQFGTSLVATDTDHDGFTDLEEILHGFSPTTSAIGSLDRAVLVDKTTQKLWYIVSGQKVKEFPVSTGNPRTPTPSGEFSVQRKREYVDYIGVDYRYPHIPWNLQFLPHYYIHTATWHNDFGIRTRSHGCVNMREADAGFLFKYLDVGVPVIVTGTTPSRFYVAK